MESQELFLEYLLQGIADLYYLHEKEKDYYFIEKDGVIQLLSNDKREIFDDKNGAAIIRSNKYLGVLNYMFQDCPQMKNQIKEVKFNAKSLIKATEQYHNYVCNDYACIDYSKTVNSQILLEGYISSYFSGMGLFYSNDYAYTTALSPGIGIWVQPKMIHDVWRFFIGLELSRNTFSGNFTHHIYDDNISYKNYIYLKSNVLRNPIKVSYSFRGKTIKPYIALGIDNIYYFNPNYHVDWYYLPEITNDVVPIKSHFRQYNCGFTGEIGVSYKLKNSSYLNLSGSYEYSLPLTHINYVLDYMYVESFVLKLGYSLAI